MSRSLHDLSPRFRPLAVEFLAQLTEAKIPVLITGTGRTAAEQQTYLRTGASTVTHSRHQDGDAIDVVPWEVYTLQPGGDKLSWDMQSPAAVRVWTAMGAIGEALGLRWGGRFAPLNAAGLGWDPGHFEYRPPMAQPSAGARL